jgi:hypothetical protein
VSPFSLQTPPFLHGNDSQGPSNKKHGWYQVENNFMQIQCVLIKNHGIAYLWGIAWKLQVYNLPFLPHSLSSTHAIPPALQVLQVKTLR